MRVGSASLVERNVRKLLAAGLRPVHVALHHGHAEIERHLRERLPRAESLAFLVEHEPLGTVGSLGSLLPLDVPVVVTNGDLLSGLDLGTLLDAHRRHGADLTIATHTERRRLKLGEVVADADGRVTAYREKPVKEYRISSGTYVFSPGAAELVTPGERVGMPDVVARALDAGLHVHAHPHDAPWIDVNDPADLTEAERLLAEHGELFDPPTTDS